MPGLNRTKTSNDKDKSNNILISKSSGVRFNENIKIDTITSNNKVNVEIFSPEVTKLVTIIFKLKLLTRAISLLN